LVSAALAIGVSAGAQDKMDKMSGMKPETSYTGCVARSQDGAFTLTHATASAMRKDSMSKNAMANDSTAKDSMSHDSMMKDDMAPSLRLSSTAVGLGKHIGHKVTVKGVAGDAMNGMTPFSVTSVRVVGKSCS
jgi:pentapeptide MXKDX repeat protein